MAIIIIIHESNVFDNFMFEEPQPTQIQNLKIPKLTVKVGQLSESDGLLHRACLGSKLTN